MIKDFNLPEGAPIYNNECRYCGDPYKGRKHSRCCYTCSENTHLTIEDAKKALSNGYKVSHAYFTDSEWIIQEGDLLKDELDIESDIDAFFKRRSHFPKRWFILR